METKMMTMLIVAGAILLTGAFYFFRNRFAGFSFEDRITGMWLNEALQIRVLVFNVESILHGSVVWTSEARSNLLGMRVLENLRMGSFRGCRGTYTDPVTFREYNVRVQMKSKTAIKLSLFCKKSNSLLYRQEWKQVPVS